MIFFSERKELEKQYYEWIKENGIADQPNCVIAFLEIHGIINYKKAREKAEIIKLKPQTNFDKITQSVESFVNWIYKNYSCMPEDIPCPMEDNTMCNEMNCKKCFTKWLQKESE